MGGKARVRGVWEVSVSTNPWHRVFLSLSAKGRTHTFKQFLNVCEDRTCPSFKKGKSPLVLKTYPSQGVGINPSEGQWMLL